MEKKIALLNRLKEMDLDDEPLEFFPRSIRTPEENEKLRSLEFDLQTSKKILDKCLVDSYATALYSTLCNATFVKEGKEPWHGSWRYVGGLVDSLVTGRGDYLNYYASGNENSIDLEVQKDLEELGWRLQD